MYNLLIASLSRRKTWPLYSRNCSAETGWQLGHVSRDWPPFGVDPGMIFTSFLRKRQQEARLEDKLWFIQQCQPRLISLILLLNCCGAYFVLYIWYLSEMTERLRRMNIFCIHILHSYSSGHGRLLSGTFASLFLYVGSIKLIYIYSICIFASTYLCFPLSLVRLRSKWSHSITSHQICSK